MNRNSSTLASGGLGGTDCALAGADAETKKSSTISAGGSSQRQTLEFNDLTQGFEWLTGQPVPKLEPVSKP